MCHNLRWATITTTAPTKATNTVGNSPQPAETPRARKIQPPHDAPDQTENQIPDQPVLAGPSASASPLTISLDFIPISHYKLYSK